jgi:hypothetical protein
MSNTKTSFVQRFMNFTGKSRSVFGPAEVSSINRALTPEKAAELKTREQEAASQWRTIERADGSSYIVPADK